MPWRCDQCSVEIDADSVAACPGCGSAKTTWTLVRDQTRRLRVGGKRFVCERGDGREPVAAPSTATYDAAAWATTDVAPAISTAEARRLARAGQGPAPADVLRVVQHVKVAPGAVRLTTLPEARNTATSEHEARPEPPHDARFLLVYGEPPDGLAFDGLQVVDVTDDTALCHAPQLEVVALKRPLQLLPIRPRAAADWDLFGFELGHPTSDEPEPADWDLFGFELGHPNGDEPGDEAAEAEPEAAPEEPDWDLFGFDLDHPTGEPTEPAREPATTGDPSDS